MLLKGAVKFLSSHTKHIGSLFYHTVNFCYNTQWSSGPSDWVSVIARCVQGGVYILKHAPVRVFMC